MFAAFGALLRLRDGATTHATRHAVVLGVALGVGALAKSFMVPWAVVCFVTLAVATRSRGLKPSLIAAFSCGWSSWVRGSWCSSHARGVSRSATPDD